MLEKYHPLWINLHFNHPNEITPEVSRAVDKLTKAGLPVGNQSVLLAGVNDCVHIQRALVHKLVANRIRPYYLYQCDLVEGSGHFRTPVGKGLEIMEGLRGHTSGYAVPTYVIDAPGGGGKIPVMPNYLISLLATTRSCCATTRATSRPTRSPTTYQKHDQRGLPRTASTSGPSRASPASSACSRASGCGSSRRASTRPTPAATPRRTASRTRRSGCRSASARSRGRPRRRCPSSRPATARRNGAKPVVRPGRGAAPARGRADRLGPRGAALGAPPRHGSAAGDRVRYAPCMAKKRESGRAVHRRDAGRVRSGDLPVDSAGA